MANLIQRIQHSLREADISLQYHDVLNPKLWLNDKLRPEVAKILLNNASAWAQFARINWAIIHDVIVTGGNANYNYTPQSDIDVHLVIDRGKINSDRYFVDDFLADKKMLWALTHNISVYGYPIEMYAQDSGEATPAGQGAYSILHDKWIQHPFHGTYDFARDPHLKRKVEFYERRINSIIAHQMGTDAVDALRKKLSNMRNAAIAKGGEFSFENLVFKELRNRGLLDRMNKYEGTLKDQKLSLK